MGLKKTASEGSKATLVTVNNTLVTTAKNAEPLKV